MASSKSNQAYTAKSEFSLRVMSCAIVLLLGCCGISVSATIEVEYEFETPILKTVDHSGQQFNQIIMLESPNSGSIGHPALPSRGARILLPYGQDVENIEAIAIQIDSLHTDLPIEPLQRPFDLSVGPDRDAPLAIDNEVYSMESSVISSRYADVSIQIFRGYRILLLKLNPVDYIPATGKISYTSRLLIRVSTSESADAIPPLRYNAADQYEVSRWLDNPNTLSSYASAEKSGMKNYDMLIITRSWLVSAFQPLKDYHDTTGVLTEIRTLTEIGSTSPHDIRDYIRQEFLDNGIQYVLLGGDDELITALDVYVISWEPPDNVVEYSMPADFYYSCLDGTFNYDGDALWAEPTDGEGGGDIDLFPDVHIGRASASSTQEVDNFVNKTLAYLTTETRSLQNVVLAGEQLTFGGMGEYGGYAMEEMVDGSDAHGFTTYGFSSEVYEIDKLYDYLILPGNYWPASEIIDRINAGVHIVDHLGHSGQQYAMRTDVAMLAQQLTNTEYCFIYAEGCSAGTYDLTDCWAEYVTTKLATGAFACIANSRLGLGSRSTAHPVHVFNREFWDAIYDANEAMPEIGRAISDSRVDHAYHINDPGIRWTFYEINLFGDPALAIKPVRSVDIDFPGGAPEIVPPDSEITFEVSVNDIGEGDHVEGSGWLHFTIGSKEPDSIAMSVVSGDLYEATLPAIECGEELTYFVSVEEASVGRIYEPDPETPYSAHAVSQEYVIFEDDFETDKGWTISGGLWERGVPLGLGGEDLQYTVPDPTEGCNGTQVLGYNLAGDYENNLPETHVTSPAIDCSGSENVRLRFCRWLGVEQPAYDRASVLVSNDLETWTLLWENYATIADLAWNDIEFDISMVADNQSDVYLRWVMGPTDGGLRFNGWNIDDVRVISMQCKSWLCGDVDGSGAVDIDDVVYLIGYIFSGGPAPQPHASGDSDCSGDVDIDDVVYLIGYIFSGGTAPCDTDGDGEPDC